MKVPVRPRQFGLSFNITPLIDIVFLLVIFFLVASHVARSESTEPVALPTASQGRDDVESLPDRLVVTVTADHRLHVAGQVVTLQDIERVLSQRENTTRAGQYEVRIRGDQRVPFRVVEPIMLACARAGITRVGYAVLPGAH